MDYSEDARRIYHQQHNRVVGDERAMQRFIGMFSENYDHQHPIARLLYGSGNLEFIASKKHLVR